MTRTRILLFCCIAILATQPTHAQQKTKQTMTKVTPKRCYILTEDIISKLKVYSRPTEHYHKLKGLYTWQEAVYVPVELEGSGEIEVRCE